MKDSALSNEEIRSRYFGAPLGESKKQVEQPTPSLELTPSAKYITREAKKQLGEQAIYGESSLGEEELFRLVRHIEETENETLSERERNAVVATLTASLEHYDILSSLVENPEVNDIIVRSYRDISIQTSRTNIQTDLSFPDPESYKSFVENLLKRAGKSCTLATPVVDCAVDPTVRACVTHESFSPPESGPMLTLRIARHHNISLEGLVQFELAPRLVLDYLGALIGSGGVSLLIAGEVGTGKTTLVKALTSKIPKDEALLVIEDTHELVLERPFVRTLLTRESNTEGAGRISPAMAIRTGMRMAMNRLILGEMRDAEAAEAFIDVCSSGHSGLSTIHGRSAKDAVSRLELFLARAQGNVNIQTIRRQIADALSVVVFLGVDRKTQKRRIMEIFEVGSYSDGAIQYSPMFRYEPHSGLPEWKRESGISLYQEALKSHKIQLPHSGEKVSFEPEQMYAAHQ